MKMRRIMPCVAPMVRRMAMSRPLSFTSMIMLETMLNAATRMIRVRIRNMTLRSTSTALKKDRLLLLPVEDADAGAERFRDLAVEMPRRRRDRSTNTSMLRHRVGGQIEEELRRRQRHEDDAAVVFVHADIEGAGDAIALMRGTVPKAVAVPWGEIRVMRVAGPDAEAEGQPRADQHGIALEFGRALRRRGCSRSVC